jgi:hypothetical protein
MPNQPHDSPETEEVVKAARELTRFLDAGNLGSCTIHRKILRDALANLDKKS